MSSLLNEIEAVFGDPLDTIASCLRGFLVPAPGKEFVCVDFASIEARVTAWLAGDEKLLKQFQNNEDVYVNTAMEIYNCKREDVDSVRRQIGKVAVLSLGFGGGKGAFQMMAKNYGVVVKDEDAERIKSAWRANHERIVYFWKNVEQMAIRAVEVPGEIRTAGPWIKYKKEGSFLCCTLPSGRIIHYPYPKVDMKPTPWGESKKSLSAKWVNSMTHKWERRTLWYGILVENVVQAVARDLLVEAILTCEDFKLPVVMHVHDEILIEEDEGATTVDYVKSIISSDMPEWAQGIPISLEGWVGKRYQK